MSRQSTLSSLSTGEEQILQQIITMVINEEKTYSQLYSTMENNTKACSIELHHQLSSKNDDTTSKKSIKSVPKLSKSAQDTLTLPFYLRRPRTRAYTRLRTSYKVEDNPSLDFLPNASFNASFTESALSEVYQTLRYKNRYSDPAKTLADNELCDNILIKVFKKHGCTSKVAELLSIVTRKNKVSILQRVKEIYQKQMTMKKKSKADRVSFRNVTLFCNICYQYGCNLHFLEMDSDHSSVEDIGEEPEFKPKLIFRKSETAWSRAYRCPDDGCYLKKPVHELRKFKRWEEKIIKRICRLGIENPCFIAKIFTSSSTTSNRPNAGAVKEEQDDEELDEEKKKLSKRTCADVYQFILQKDFIKKSREEAENDSDEAEVLLPIDSPDVDDSLSESLQAQKDYTPCQHPGECSYETCICVRERGVCEKWCFCAKTCKARYEGCSCRKNNCNSKQCKCVARGRECDPDLCKSCHCDVHQHNTPDDEIPKTVSLCKNVNLLYSNKQKLEIAQSRVCDGYGLFTLQPVKKKQLVYEYTGEILSADEAERRGRIYDNLLGHSFLFTLTETLRIDADLKGNKLRYANYGDRANDNTYPEIKFVNGTHRIGLYAKRDIAAGEELLFNYNYEVLPKWLQDIKDRQEGMNVDG